MWQIEIIHEGLHKYRLIKGTNKNVVEQKAAAQKAVWDEMWLKRLEIKEKVNQREAMMFAKESKIEEARKRTEDAIITIDAIKNILKHTLDHNDAVDWETLKDTSLYDKPKPEKKHPIRIPEPPRSSDREPQLGILDKIFKSRGQNKIDNAKMIFDRDYQAWQKKKDELITRNKESDEQYTRDLENWEKEKQEFENKKKEHNDALEERKKEYLEKNTEAIIDYCDLVLSLSEYPDYFPQQYDIDYNPLNKIVIVEYTLPSIDDLPRLKEVKYVQSRDQFTETFISDTVLNKLYDDLVYQIALRTIHELFEADIIKAIDAVVYNGWVETVDKATGKKIKPCIISIQAKREEFLTINLRDVDPKMCFKNLKGVGSSKLYSLTPIAPILNISREDKRFIAGYNVVADLNESINLAVMDWEDFEHLIREIFEKEFGESGGEVKITRASRDSGVDAVAFDPDPIRGGKIVIQAKRYTNTVGVSSVRDLYGTVLNEGATKGILVTTTDYGPDAYEFAKGKPLTLLSGSNLLHLLEKHGHKATIDLKEAKRILAEKDKI